MRSSPQCWLTDIDGVLVHEECALPDAADFPQRLTDEERPLLVLTNSSIFTPRDLAARLLPSGTDAVAAIEAGLETTLVLTGSTAVADIEKYPFQPSRVLDSIADAVELT